MEFAYNEFKFKVDNRELYNIINLLEGLLGNTDPFSFGIVDSLYYDSLDKACYEQCLNGVLDKVKFRLRGYGDGTFTQVHQKNKSMFRVGKYKAKFKEALKITPYSVPSWTEVINAEHKTSEDQLSSLKISNTAGQFGFLVPAMRIEYKRRRYRFKDYRITLDYDIWATPASSHFGRNEKVRLPHHVLEIKTNIERPYLPTLGLSKLPQISFSKYFLALQMLEGDKQDSLLGVL